MFVTGGKQLLVEPRALQKREEPVGSANRDWLNLEANLEIDVCECVIFKMVQIPG